MHSVHMQRRQRTINLYIRYEPYGTLEDLAQPRNKHMEGEYQALIWLENQYLVSLHFSQLRQWSTKVPGLLTHVTLNLYWIKATARNQNSLLPPECPNFEAGATVLCSGFSGLWISSLASQKNSCHSKNLFPLLPIQLPQISGSFVHSFTYSPSNPPGGRTWAADLSLPAGACSAWQARHVKCWCPLLLFQCLSSKWALCMWMPLLGWDICTLHRGISYCSGWTQAPKKGLEVFLWPFLLNASRTGLMPDALWFSFIPCTACKGSLIWMSVLKVRFLILVLQATVWVPEEDGLDLAHFKIFFLSNPSIFPYLDHWRT